MKNDMNEPVAWMREDGVIAFHAQKEVDSQGYKWQPLYTHPVKKQVETIEYTCPNCQTHVGLHVKHPVKDLEDIEINITWNETSMRDFGKEELAFAKAILRKAQEK